MNPEDKASSIWMLKGFFRELAGLNWRCTRICVPAVLHSTILLSGKDAWSIISLVAFTKAVHGCNIMVNIMLNINGNIMLNLLSLPAPKFGHQSSKHWIQHSDYGVWQIHLHKRESRRTGSSGDHWHEWPQQPYPKTNFSWQCHHEPCQ